MNDSISTCSLSQSVLSEILSEDKKTGGTVSSSAIVGIVRKAVARRVSEVIPFSHGGTGR